jgi:hypothetical protein
MNPKGKMENEIPAHNKGLSFLLPASFQVHQAARIESGNMINPKKPEKKLKPKKNISLTSIIFSFPFKLNIKQFFC